MRVVTNMKRVKWGRFIATTTSLSGLLMLIIATVLTFYAPRLSTSLAPTFLIGVIIAMVGIRSSRRWLQPPIPHDALNAALRGMGKDAILYHYWLPAKHVLVCQHGIFSLTACPQELTLSIRKNDWEINETLFGRLKRLLTQNLLGNPLRDALREAQHTQSWLDNHLSDHQVAVSPIIVFTNPKTKIQVIDTPDTPATYADKRKPALKSHIRGCSALPLSPAQVTEIENALGIRND